MPLSLANRLRVLYVVEFIVLVACVVGGSFPGLISLMSLDFVDDGDGLQTTFARLQLVLSMALSVPIGVLLLTFLTMPGEGVRSLRVQGIVAALLLLPSAVAALATWTQPELSVTFGVHPVLRVALMASPALAFVSLFSTQGGQQHPWLGWGLTGFLLVLGTTLNVVGGFLALMEISVWV